MQRLTKKNILQNKMVEVGQNIKVQVLDKRKGKKRISLRKKKSEPNIQENILNEYKNYKIIFIKKKNKKEIKKKYK